MERGRRRVIVRGPGDVPHPAMGAGTGWVLCDLYFPNGSRFRSGLATCIGVHWSGSAKPGSITWPGSKSSFTSSSSTIRG